MKRTYNKIDKHHEILIDYLSEFFEIGGRDDNDMYNEKYLKPRRKDHHNISIILENSELDYVTKRAFLVGDKLTFTHDGELNEYELYHEYSYDGAGESSENYFYLKCPDIKKVAQWIVDMRDLVVEEQALYFPRIRNEGFQVSGWAGKHDTDNIREIFDIAVKNSSFTEVINNDYSLDSNLISKVLEIDIPFIDDTNLHDFSNLILEHNDKFMTFKLNLQNQLLEMKGTQGSIEEKAEIRKISNKLKSDITLLNKDISNFEKTGLFEKTGATIKFTTATLVSVNSLIFNLLPEYIGLGGFALFMKAVYDTLNDMKNKIRNKQKIENNPNYFLWLLKKKM